MSDITAKEVGNEVYDSLMALLGAYIVSLISKGLLKKSLGTPENIEGMVKLAIALGIGAALVDMAQTKGMLPAAPFKGEHGDKETDVREVGDEIYESLLALIGAFLVSRASKGLLHRSLGAPETIEGGAKLAIALGIGAAGVTYLQNKDWLPKKIFKD